MEEKTRKSVKSLLFGLPVRNSEHFSKVSDDDTRKKSGTQFPVFIGKVPKITKFFFRISQILELKTDCSDENDGLDEAKEITNQKADLFLRYIHRLVENRIRFYKNFPRLEA